MRQLINEVLRNSGWAFFSYFAWQLAVCADTEKVVDAITSPSNEAPSPTAGLLDEIALALDGTSLALSNWYTLALKLGVPRKTCRKFGRRSTENLTGRLFKYLATTCPQKTLLSLKEALKIIERRDLVKYLNEEKLKGRVSALHHK